MVSKKSGHLYEKRLILKVIQVRAAGALWAAGGALQSAQCAAAAVATAAGGGGTDRRALLCSPVTCPFPHVCSSAQETGRDPVTAEVLGEDDLLELVGGQSAKPRPTPAASIPGLLSLFQNVRPTACLAVIACRTCCCACFGPPWGLPYLTLHRLLFVGVAQAAPAALVVVAARRSGMPPCWRSTSCGKACRRCGRS